MFIQTEYRLTLRADNADQGLPILNQFERSRREKNLLRKEKNILSVIQLKIII